MLREGLEDVFRMLDWISDGSFDSCIMVSLREAVLRGVYDPIIPNSS